MNYDPDENYSEGGTDWNQWAVLIGIGALVLVLVILACIYR
jgi:hypothetical protein